MCTYVFILILVTDQHFGANCGLSICIKAVDCNPRNISKGFLNIYAFCKTGTALKNPIRLYVSPGKKIFVNKEKYTFSNY